MPASRRCASLRGGSPPGALLFLPNITRAFFVLVMSSSAGAAIGVTEGITVILRQAEQLPALGDRLVLFAIGMLPVRHPAAGRFRVDSPDPTPSRPHRPTEPGKVLTDKTTVPIEQ